MRGVDVAAVEDKRQRERRRRGSGRRQWRGRPTALPRQCRLLASPPLACLIHQGASQARRRARRAAPDRSALPQVKITSPGPGNKQGSAALRPDQREKWWEAGPAFHARHAAAPVFSSRPGGKKPSCGRLISIAHSSDQRHLLKAIPGPCCRTTCSADLCGALQQPQALQRRTGLW